MALQTDSATIWVQVRPGVQAVTPQSATEDFVRATENKLKEVSELVRKSWQSMVTDISSLPSPPAEIGLEFGIDVGAEAGVPFITKGSLGANFKVTLTWRK